MTGAPLSASGWAGARVSQQDIDNRRRPLLTVLYGGPGAGKSTTAAAVFAILKQHQVNVEIVHEVAKDLVWEHRHVALGHQPYIAAKQMFRWDRLAGEVDCIVTDTSTLLGTIYGNKRSGVTDAFREWLVDDYERRRTLNFFLTRDPSRAYNPKGRRQSEDSAKAADESIRRMLGHYNVNFVEVAMGPVAAPTIARRVYEEL